MRLFALVMTAALAIPGAVLAQEASAPPDPTSPATATPSTIDAAPRLNDTRLPALQLPKRSMFSTIGHDMSGFLSGDTARILATFAVAGAAARPVDRAGVEDANEHLSGGFEAVGNTAGSLYLQLGGATATYLVGRASGHSEIAALGTELFRAQILSQLVVQGAKFAVRRQRPDASNAMSFPSGHTASAFATATVLQDRFGWKAGIPAYAFAGMVAASRMGSQKHYLSDVLVGAGIGIAAGRTVSVHLGHRAFAIGAAPTAGGAMVTFTGK